MGITWGNTWEYYGKNMGRIWEITWENDDFCMNNLGIIYKKIGLIQLRDTPQLLQTKLSTSGTTL